MWRQIPVLKRLVPSLRKRLARLTWTEGFAIVRADGALFLLNHRNYVDRQIAFFGDFETDQLAYLLECIRRYRCTTFIDVGANIGLYLIRVAQSVPTCGLIAFEPDARNHDQLRANLYLNGLSTRAQVHLVALSNRTGKVAFEAFADTSTGQSRVSATHAGLEVDAARLDDLLDLNDQRLAIKIDIEGHEAAALQGMRTLLTRNRCIVQAEVFPPRLEAARNLLGELGYRERHAISHDHYFHNFPED